MKQLGLLLLAAVGNGLGSAIMFETHIGMSAWGSAASNMSLFFGMSPGVAFIHISIWFYLIAVILNKTIVLRDMFLSMAFLIAFSGLMDGFIALIPDLTSMSMVSRIALNILGMLILLGSISLHLHINLAVHPMDVFLKAMQDRFDNVAIGTYLAYGSAFLVAVVFGILAGGIRDIGIGTALILVLGGVIMHGYDKVIFSKWKDTTTHVSD